MCSAKKEHTPEEYEALTGSLQKQVSRLRELVTELLNLANLEHQPKWETVSLSDLFRSICQELSETAAQKNVSFICSSSQLTVLGDSGLLYRALFNLVENAVKYNVAGGSVEIACEAKADHTIITIADTGIGIPDSVKHRIFEPFFRVDPSRSREMGGAGLGLAMVERIINQHQGRISLTDRPGGGSLFTVCLPKEP